MKSLFPILSNLTMLALLCLVLVAFYERLLNILMRGQVRGNLARIEQGQIVPLFSMKDFRKVYDQRRAARITAAVLAGGILLSAGTLYVVKAEGLQPIEQIRTDYSKRNELLARAERMARAGNKGLMRVNITHARKFGPVDTLMVMRIESFLAH